MDNYNNNDSPYFRHIKDEIEFYKFKFLQKKEELYKSNQKIKILEKLNKKLLHKLNTYTISKIKRNIANNNNNVENKIILIKKENNSSFFNNRNKNKNNYSKEITPNEFKNLWESIIQTELIDNFDFCINEYLLISYLCQDIILLVYNESQNEIHNKLNQVLKYLNLDKLSKSKINLIYDEFLPFFREYSNYIFEFSNSFLNNIHKKLILIIKEYNYEKLKINKSNDLKNDSSSKDLDTKMLLILETKINEGHFDSLIKSFYKICLYMLLHDPTLNFNIDKYHERKHNFQYYNKNNFINVEGFGNELSPCILLLSPPLLKNKYPYNGLRSAVYIIPDPDKNIYLECDANKSLIKEENNDIYLEEKNSDQILKKESKNVNLKNNVLCQNNFKNHSNNIILRNKKKINDNSELKIETFNFNTGFNINKNQINGNLQNCKNDKLIISNSLGDIFIKNENKKNKDRNVFNKISKNKNNSKENIHTRKSFMDNMNFVSIKHFSKNNLILPTEEKEETYIHNFNNNYIINNVRGNKTPIISKKSDNIYKPFQQHLNIDNNLIGTDEERYFQNNYINSNESKMNINQKGKIYNSIYNNKNINKNKIINYKKSYSTIINSDNLYDNYYSEINFTDSNKLNPNLYISYNDKPFRNSNNEISSLENRIDSNNSNIYDNNNYYQKHSFNTIVFNSFDNNIYEDFNDFPNVSNSNNFPRINRNNIINYDNIKPNNNIENIKKRKLKSDKIKIIKNINNEKNINIYYLKDKKNFNINLNTTAIDNNERYTDNNMIRRKEINNNNNEINKKNLINQKLTKIELYTINNNKISNKKKIKRIKNISQKFINHNHKDIIINNDNNLVNTLNDIYYLNNEKNKQSKTIDNNKIIKKDYIKKNTSYKNIFYNGENNINNHDKKYINYSNLYEPNYEKSEYNNIIYQKKSNNKIN